MPISQKGFQATRGSGVWVKTFDLTPTRMQPDADLSTQTEQDSTAASLDTWGQGVALVERGHGRRDIHFYSSKQGHLGAGIYIIIPASEDTWAQKQRGPQQRVAQFRHLAEVPVEEGRVEGPLEGRHALHVAQPGVQARVIAQGSR